MQREAMLYCPACARLTHHASQGRYDHMGALKAVEERCLRCGRTDAGHEIPPDAEIAAVALSPLEHDRCRYHRWRWRRGELTEYPPTPGVWG